jgi:hypothetical protein
MDSIRLAQEIAALRQRIAALESRERLVASDANPVALGAVTPGLDTEVSRGDHVHAMPTATQVGAVPTTGGTFTGDIVIGEDLGGSRSIVINSGSNSTRGFLFRTNSLNRWGVQTTVAEAGSESGSDFRIVSLPDSGAAPSTVRMYIQRLTGNVGIGVFSDTSFPLYRLHVNGDANLSSTFVYRVNGTQVVAARRTGWAAATGTATRTTFATSTVTTAQLAERVKALLDDLIAHGLLGA